MSLENLSDENKKAVKKQYENLKVFMDKHHEKMADLMHSDEMQERLEFLSAANERLAVEDDPKNRDLVHKEVQEVILELERKKFEVMGLPLQEIEIHEGLIRQKQAILAKLIDGHALANMTEQQIVELDRKASLQDKKNCQSYQDVFSSKEI